MRKKTIFPLIAIVVTITALGWGINWYFQNQEVIQPEITSFFTGRRAVSATLAFQQGTVEVNFGSTESGDQNWRSVETDTILHEGDGIRTGAGSKAIIELENKKTIRLGYDTELFLTDLQKNNVTVIQIAGASYSRVEGSYIVKADTATIKAQGTAFDVIMGSGAIDVGVVESAVTVIIEEGEHRVTEGNVANIDTDSLDVSVSKLDESILTNDWYTWNKEEDSKTTEDLGILKDYAGPELSVLSPANDTSIGVGSVTVEGTVGDTATSLTVNGEPATISDGTYSKEIKLSAGKNAITVIAEDDNGKRSAKEVRVTYDVPVSATPLVLSGETQSDGVHLWWNLTTASENVFQYYKVVRSETNPDLKYPEDGYISVLNKGKEFYEDTDVDEGVTYYYRVCEVMSASKIYCSNVVNMTGTAPEDSTEEYDQGNSDDIEDTVEGESISLSAEAKSDGIHLSWTVSGITPENGFKVVKGDSVNPVFPGNEYAYLSDSASKSYIWSVTDGNVYHFRVCEYSGSGECSIYSNDLEVTAHELTTSDIGLSMSVKAEATGVGIWWTDASSIAGFKYYKVVRSETNSDLRYPDDNYIAVKSNGQESHRDYSSVKSKSYYYRICAVGSSIVCSNVEQVTAINENPVPDAVTLSARYGDTGLELSWTKSAESDFSFYKVVWSQTNSLPKYPVDLYIKAEGSISKVSFMDDGSAAGGRATSADLATGTHYYSVCVVDQASQVTCSNVVTLVDGVLQ